MSINYKIIAHKDPRDLEAPPQFYGSVNTKGRRNMRYIAKQISSRSSLNEMDVLSVIEGFLQIIPETLNDGYSVDLGDFAILSLIAKSNAAKTEQEFNASYFEGVKVKFRPGKIFKTTLKNAEYVKIQDKN